MSRRCGFGISYDAAFSRQNIRRMLESLQLAVQDKWTQTKDEWSDPSPTWPVHIESWTDEATPERMQRVVSNSPVLATRDFNLSFSPVSDGLAWLIVFCGADQRLEVSLSVSDRLLCEVQGAREIERMEKEWENIRRQRGETGVREIGPDWDDPRYDEWHEKWIELESTPNVWPLNKQCLQHILEKLKSVLPVRSVEIDEELAEQ